MDERITLLEERRREEEAAGGGDDGRRGEEGLVCDILAVVERNEVRRELTVVGAIESEGKVRVGSGPADEPAKLCVSGKSRKERRDRITSCPTSRRSSRHPARDKSRPPTEREGLPAAAASCRNAGREDTATKGAKGRL